MASLDKHATLTAQNIIGAYTSAFQSVNGHSLTTCEHTGGRWFKVDGEMRDREWMIREIQRLREVALEKQADEEAASDSQTQRSRLMKMIGKLSGRGKTSAIKNPDETLAVKSEARDHAQNVSRPEHRDVYFFGVNDTLLLNLGVETLAFKSFDSILLGRDPDFPGRTVDLTGYNGLEKGVSRRHAQISYVPEDDYLEIIDGSSANGTYINGQMLNPLQPYRLYDGDTLHLGAMGMQVRFVRGK